jgi:hypothetical protein
MVSVYAAKAFDKIQYPSMIKVLNKLEREGICINILKTTYSKTTANIVLNEEI